MTAPYGRPDALIDTSHGPARVYSSRGSATLDAAIVTDDYELLIPEREIEHLIKGIAAYYDSTAPDEPTADDIRDKAGDFARALRKCITANRRLMATAEHWDADTLPALFDIIDGFLVELDDVAADLDSLTNGR